MRRLVVLVILLALAAPAAVSGSVRGASDGTLSIRDLNGVPAGVSLEIRARGGLIGRCDQCAFRLEDRDPADLAVPIVAGTDLTKRDIDGDDEIEFYTGSDVRWKMIGGKFTLRVRQGRDVDISVAGTGLVRLRGAAGTYSVNGGNDEPVLPEFDAFILNAATPPG